MAILAQVAHWYLFAEFHSDDMAFVLAVSGGIKWYADVQAALDDFMRQYGVEWLTLGLEQLETDATPWRHPNLQLDDADARDPEHFEIDQWRYHTQAVVSENGIAEDLPMNPWCSALRGPILVYSSCVCAWDGAQYKCETGRMDWARCVRVLCDRFGCPWPLDL